MAFRSTTVPDDELQDFWRGCDGLGFKPQTFIVSAMENVPAQPGPIARIVKVERLGLTRDFDGGSGKDWIEPALNAVRSGLFGT